MTPSSAVQMLRLIFPRIHYCGASLSGDTSDLQKELKVDKENQLLSTLNQYPLMLRTVLDKSDGAGSVAAQIFFSIVLRIQRFVPTFRF